MFLHVRVVCLRACVFGARARARWGGMRVTVNGGLGMLMIRTSEVKGNSRSKNGRERDHGARAEEGKAWAQ